MLGKKKDIMLEVPVVLSLEEILGTLYRGHIRYTMCISSFNRVGPIGDSQVFLL